MKNLYLSILSLLFYFNINAQCDSSKVAKPGTYEIKPMASAVEAIQTSVNIQFKMEDLCTIESKRDNNNYVEWIWQDKYIIRIFPKSMLKNKSVK